MNRIVFNITPSYDLQLPKMRMLRIPESGEVRTGAAFATCSGFIAWALAEALGTVRK